MNTFTIFKRELTSYFTQPTDGPSITDPRFPDWYYAEYIKLPSFVVHASVFQGIELFLDETGVDPMVWRSQKGSKDFRSGKQGYFFKMKLKEAGEALQRTSSQFVTGEPWVSSVVLVLSLQPPGAKEPLSLVELKADFDGLTVAYSVNKKYRVDYD